jgi:hypothetical protein
VWNRGDVFDLLDVQACSLKSGDCAFTSRTGTLDANFDISHSELGRFFSGLLGRALTGERSALAAALETTGSGAGPAQRVPFGIGDGDHRIVEGRDDERDSVGNVTTDSLFLVGLCHGIGVSVLRDSEWKWIWFCGNGQGRCQNACRWPDSGKLGSQETCDGRWPIACPSRPSCLQRSFEDLFGSVNLFWYAGHAQGDPGDGACHDRI